MVTLATLRRPVGAILLACYVMASSADSDLLRDLLELPSAALDIINDGVGDRLAAKHGGSDGIGGRLLDADFVQEQVDLDPRLSPDVFFGLLVQLVAFTERRLTEVGQLGAAPLPIADAAAEAAEPLADLLGALLSDD